MCTCGSDECYECMQRELGNYIKESHTDSFQRNSDKRKQKIAELAKQHSRTCERCGAKVTVAFAANLPALWADHVDTCPARGTAVLTQYDKNFLQQLKVGWSA